MPSFYQKLAELSTKLNNFEAPSRILINNTCQNFVQDIFGFAIDSKCNEFCSNFVLATHLNPKLAGDMNDSSTVIAETELKRRVIKLSRHTDTQNELIEWKRDVEFASLVSLNALLSADSKNEANFNAIIFWTEKRQKYPTLSKIAINLLTIPAYVQTPAFNEFSFDSLEELKHQAMFLLNKKFSV
ncbi:hypothetical protein M3Y97_00901000 [Aphelenchoides bicaudatus]|nr:hypothetical protein M3Y97_00901000 [Aphelenchoides bicaudatus]